MPSSAHRSYRSCSRQVQADERRNRDAFTHDGPVDCYISIATKLVGRTRTTNHRELLSRELLRGHACDGPDARPVEIQRMLGCLAHACHCHCHSVILAYEKGTEWLRSTSQCQDTSPELLRKISALARGDQICGSATNSWEWASESPTSSLRACHQHFGITQHDLQLNATIDSQSLRFPANSRLFSLAPER